MCEIINSQEANAKYEEIQDNNEIVYNRARYMEIKFHVPFCLENTVLQRCRAVFFV